MDENASKVLIIPILVAVVICLLVLGANKASQNELSVEYNAVEINGETFYEKEEDSNFAIDSVVTKDGNFFEYPKTILLLVNDSGNVDSLDLRETEAYEQIQGVSVEKSYIRKVTSNPASNLESSTKYFLYLTKDDDEKLLAIIKEQYLGDAGYDITSLN